MKWQQMLPTIPRIGRDCSLLLVEPKPEFLAWLTIFLQNRGRGHRQVYFPEENSAWLVPSYSKLADCYDQFLNDVTPMLLRAELFRFGAVEADFPKPISRATFDEFFTLALRDEVIPLTELLT
jgi:hypothetical protein